LTIISDETRIQLPPAEQLFEICSETTSLHHKVQRMSHEKNNAKWSCKWAQSTCNQKSM